MARLLLEARVDFTVPCVYRGTTPPTTVHIPCYHPYVRLYLVPPAEVVGWRPPQDLGHARLFDAIVDTGASLTNLPHDVWTVIDGTSTSEIRWLERTESDPIHIGGQRHNFRLGRVLLAAMDWQGRWMPPAWTTVRCLDQTDEPIPALLGLLSPFLTERRQLRHADDNRSRPVWWLEDPRW